MSSQEQSKSVSEKTLHLNSAQQRFLAADCKEMYNVWGRGAGKTNGLAKYQSRNMHSMPRCTRLMLGPSYRKTITDLLPGIIAEWERQGYKRDVHFVIGKSPIPKKKKWLDPIYVPEQSYREHIIHWYTGAAYRIGSADRKTTLNGLNLDGIDADEVKLIDEDVFKEILKVNRANPDQPWSHLPEHNSIVCFTDKYWIRKKGDWIMKKKPLSDNRKLKDIYFSQLLLDKLTYVNGEGELCYTNPKQALRLSNKLIELRNQTVAFIEAATWVNIPAIHPNFIEQMKRNMGVNEFRASILNHDIQRNDTDAYFYPLLDESVHGYYADDFSKLDNLQYDFKALQNLNCKYDTDIDNSLPIDISCDWGGNINTMVVCQEVGNSFNVINSFYTKHPEGIRQLAQRFNDYYRTHKVKEINFYYDPSGNNKMPNSAETVAEEFARHLRNDGWVVYMAHLGAHNNPQYSFRYYLWQQILSSGKNHDPRFPSFFMNRNNCKEVFISMLNAKILKFDKKLKKDKASEKSGSGVLPEHATHFSDCVDYIIERKYGHLMDDSDIPTTLLD